MSTARNARLTPRQLALKHACAEAVHAAGGQVFVGGEVDRTQSRISDYCSPATTEFMPLDIVAKIEALGAGSPGHPHVTRALARAAGVSLSASHPAPSAMEDLGDWMAAIAREHADLFGVLAGQDLRAACDTLSPNARASIGREADQLIDQLQQLRRAVDGHGDSIVPINDRRGGSNTS